MKGVRQFTREKKHLEKHRPNCFGYQGEYNCSETASTEECIVHEQQRRKSQRLPTSIIQNLAYQKLKEKVLNKIADGLEVGYLLC